MTPAESSWPQPPQDPIPAAPPPTATAIPSAPGRPFEPKSPRLAALLSLFPGLGNLYNGLYLRGLIEFMIVTGLLSVVDRSGAPFFVMSLIFFWAFNVLDAYRQAVLINYGYGQDLGLLDSPRRPKPGQGGLLAGVILTAVGLFALVEQYVEIDLEWLYDLWPLLLVGAGLWLIVAAVRERKASEPDSL